MSIKAHTMYLSICWIFFVYVIY